MRAPPRVLYPVDLSDRSRAVLDYAITVAKSWNGMLVGLYAFGAPRRCEPPCGHGAYSPPWPREADIADMNETLRKWLQPAADAGLRTDAIVCSGAPVGRIIDYAKTLPADLIVMGTHGRTGFSRLVAGSVTERVTRLAQCPVLSMPLAGLHAAPARLRGLPRDRDERPAGTSPSLRRHGGLRIPAGLQETFGARFHQYRNGVRRFVRPNEDPKRLSMVNTPESVAAFLRGRRIAVAGVSRQPNQAANAVFRKLRGAGYDVFPINPKASEVEGARCYPEVKAVPGQLDGVVIATAPDVSVQIVRQCSDHGVRRVWFHRSFGNGSVSEEAVRECEAHGVDCIIGGCPLMFCDPVDFGHKCMRWWLRRQGRVPK